MINPKSNIKKLNISNSTILGKQFSDFENKKKENNNYNSAKDINSIIVKKNINEKIDKKGNTINIDSLGKSQFTLDLKSLALISKKMKINALKKKPEPNSLEVF